MIPVIKPAGIADLKVTKYKLMRYDAGEVAHIENVLASEKRKREHRRLRQFEEIERRELEREEESVRDLQTTERFELKNESEKTIRSETSFQAGLQASGGWGPVSITAFANYDTSTSKEESDRRATEYAKEITEKTVSRLLEKVRQERQTRILEETEEVNLHKFDNQTAANIAGVYRWVDKYYRAKVVDYGKRLMYEFTVPEPAAFLAFATQQNLEARVLPVKPLEPVNDEGQPLSASDINRDNYAALAAAHGAVDVQPPPPRWAKIAKAFHREAPGEVESWAFSTDDLKVPPGYRAISGYCCVTWKPHDHLQNGGVATIGLNACAFSDERECMLYLHSEELTFNYEHGTIPVNVVAHQLKEFGLNVEALCQLRGAEFGRWRLETYAAIMNAYRKALMDYEDRIASAAIAGTIPIGSQNPEINRLIQLRELKRACLSLWAGLEFEDFAAISHDEEARPPGNYPEIDIANAIGNSEAIQFFEKAFDWTHVAYEFLPYFWGRKGRWVDLLGLSSEDPLFQSFLQAGAARVLVPVQPSFSEAVLYYQLTGEIWNGGEIHAFDDLFDPDPDVRLYNSYLGELDDAADLPDIEGDIDIPPDDPGAWPVKIPTTLVWLQPDGALPNLEA